MDYIFIDTETDTFQKDKSTKELTFKLGVYQKVVKKRGEFKFISPKSFLNINEFHKNVFKDLEAKTWLVAHNWHFDFFSGNFTAFLERYGFKVEFFSFDANRFILNAKNGDKEIFFVDTFNFFQFSLRKMGEIIGVKKLEIDFDKATQTELIVYCVRDVEVLAKFFVKFLEFAKKHKVTIKYTSASSAFRTYFNRFVTAKLDKSCVETEKLEAESYYGGRVECFRLGEFRGDDKYYMLDINSLYPFVMSKNFFPTKEVGYKTDYFIADCSVTLEKPILPYRMNGKLCFPIGTFRGVWCSCELNNPDVKIVKIHKIVYYEAENIFSDYVNYFYPLKQNAKNDFEKLFSKLLLNSLYGKFGQKYIKTTKEGKTNLDNGVHNSNIGCYVVLNGEMFFSETFGYHKKSRVAIASFCTAYARAYLWKSINIAGLENCFYCDTDSLILNEKGFLKLKDFISDELGDWKLEGCSKSVDIRGCKMYQFGKKLRVKGVKQAKSFELSYRQDRWLKTKSLMKKGVFDKVIIEDYIKNLSYIYDKGIVEGNKVYPIKLSL